MPKVIVQHHVTDYDRWFSAFTAHEVVRKQHGATSHSVSRAVDEPNEIVVVTEFATVEGARSFVEHPSLREVMDRAGVEGPRQFWIAEESDARTY